MICLFRESVAAAAGGFNKWRDPRTAPLLDALDARLMPGSWLGDVAEVAVAGGVVTAKAALERLCVGEAGCCNLVLALAANHADGDRRRGGRCGSGASLSATLWTAVGSMASRPIPALGSLMRSACPGCSPAMALLGQWGAALDSNNGTLVLLLPPSIDAAVACLDAVLPVVGHVLAQADSGRAATPILRG